MKFITLAVLLLLVCMPTESFARGGHGGASYHSGYRSPGEHYVRGYVRSNGTYVEPHFQTNPNDTKNDNWSTIGNVNPHTGEPGTKPGDH